MSHPSANPSDGQQPYAQQPYGQPTQQPYPPEAYAQQPHPQQAYGQQPYGQPSAAPSDGAPSFAAVPPPPPGLGRGDRGGLKALFDFNFDSYATPAIVKIVFVIAIVLAVLGWLGSALMYFILGGLMLDSRSSEDAGAVLIVWGVLTLLFGWIPGLLTIAFGRMQLELVLATVRTNIAVNAIRTKLDA